jgi:hypothetical protein
MNIKAKLKGAWAKLAEYLTRKSEPAHFERMNLHQDVCKAFQDSQKPVERRATPSTFGKTSQGKNWYPRGRRYVGQEVDLPKEMQLPRKSPFTSELTLATGGVYLRRHGTLQRVDKLFAGA